MTLQQSVAILSYFSFCWDKIPDTHNLKEQRFILVYKFVEVLVHSHRAPGESGMVEKKSSSWHSGKQKRTKGELGK